MLDSTAVYMIAGVSFDFSNNGNEYRNECLGYVSFLKDKKLLDDLDHIIKVIFYAKEAIGKV